MHHFLVTSSAVVVTLLATACSSVSPAFRIGSVTEVTDRGLQVCVDQEAATPSAAQDVQIVRRQRTGNYKVAPKFRDRVVGTARIGNAVSGRCVDARLLRGVARLDDQVYPAQGDAKP